MPSFPSVDLSRRQAIRRTLVFSTALLASRWDSVLQAGPAVPTPAGPGEMNLLLMADWGTGNEHQARVARAMGAFARRLPAPPTGVLALGDNFYGNLTPERIQREFEEMYSAQDLPCPFHLLLGNHDYGPFYDDPHPQGSAKAQMQLDYARDNPHSRFKLPAKWYALELPDARNPLVKIVFFDTDSVKDGLTPEETLAQGKFLDEELARPTRAPWLWLAGHHPLFSNGSHGDNLELIGRFGPLIERHPISFYLCGHDHTLQHLELEGYNASFIVSGGAGAPLHDIKRGDRGYANKILGFNHLHVTPEFVDVQFIDSKGACLHSFRRTLDGKVSVTTPD